MESNPKNKWDARMQASSDYLTRSFASFIYDRPITVMVITGFLTVVLMALGLNLSPRPDFSDAAKGFETRHTDLSGRVVTWTKLDEELSIYPDLSKTYFRQLQQAPASTEAPDTSADISLRRKRQAPKHDLKTHGHGNALESLLTGALDTSPCFQLGTSYDFDDVDHFSQVIFESPSLDHLFSLTAIQELCNFQISVNETFDPIRSIIDFPYFWSLPNYIACLNGEFSCTQLTESTIQTTAKLIKECYEYQDTIIPCGTPADSTRYWRKSFNCSILPEQCRSKYIYDLYYFILSSNVGREGAKPIYTNVVFPILQLEAYTYLGTQGVTSDNMTNIYDQVLELTENVKQAKLAGINIGAKFDLWLRSLYDDSYYVLAAWILVYLIIWLYSGSLFFTVSVFLSVVLSMGVAYFVYRLVFRLKFFPFMNLFMVILLVGIGADDTFVLKHIYDTSSQRIRKISTNGSQITAPTPFTKEDMCDALSHAALSMFICIATTAAAFYANLVSDIVVIKCFGVFAGTTMLVNYLLVVTWLPASLIVLENYLNPFYDRICNDRFMKSIRKIWAMGAFVPNFFLLTLLPKFILKLKYLLIFIFSSIFVAACVVVFYRPGVALPTRNPVQMFKPSNPMEWYDNYISEYFLFAQEKYKEPIEFAIVFGIRPLDDNPWMDPNDVNKNKNKFQIDQGFQLNISFLNAINDVCHQANNSTFTYSTIKCFPDEFFKWSAKQDCSHTKNITGQPCCNINQKTFNESRDLTFCLAQSTKTLDAMWGGPIFRMNDLNGADGFLLYYDANYTWTTDYGGLNAFFTNVDGGVKKILANSDMQVIRDGWTAATFVYNLQWYDLQRNLLRGTPTGILVSVGLALIVAAITMRGFIISVLSIITVFAINVVTIGCLILLDWHLNIVESALIILTVGLAFDFTLNYAVAYQLSPVGTREEKVSTVLQYMGMPVFLAFLTTFIAGLIMLPATIMAYYQIGLFLTLIGLISWLYSALFFLSLLAVFGPEECEWTLLQRFVPSLAKRLLNRRETNQESSNGTVSGASVNNRVENTELSLHHAIPSNGDQNKEKEVTTTSIITKGSLTN